MLQLLQRYFHLKKDSWNANCIASHMVLGGNEYLKGQTVVLFVRESLCEYVLLG